ncbi:MAG: hypothetical protein FWG92_00825 [Leptospirales bacterium]|nr:hypothetical protein [Leptospirales bacterium]
MPEEIFRRITVFDTTLRDGDQSAGFAFSQEAKLTLVRMLATAGVDIIETGFPLSSKSEFNMCRAAALELKDFNQSFGGKTITSVLSRGLAHEIVQTAKVFEGGLSGTIHISLPVSKGHISAKLNKTESELLSMAVESASLAAGFTPNVQLGAEDATRTDYSFLLEYCIAVIEAGATVVNLTDTAGAASPEGMAELAGFLIKNVPAFSSGKAVLSAHCHNDLGLACANTLAALKAGCGQVEVSISGIGERAGNAALEEVFASLEEHPHIYKVRTGIISKEIGGLIAAASAFSGTAFSLMKPLSGWNIRAHASGIHQQSIARDPRTYCLSVIENINAVPERIVLSRHSGKAGVKLFAARRLDIELEENTALKISARIKESPLVATGITEFILILRDMDILPPSSPPPFTIEMFSEKISETTGSQSCTVEAELKTAGGKTLKVYAEASGMKEAILQALETLGEGSLNVKNIFFSGRGSSIRLYVEIAAPSGREYPIERAGSSSSRALFESCLDVINAEKIRKN